MNPATCCDPSIGTVVLVRSAVGLQGLAVVADVAEREQGPDAGEWWLVMDGSGRLVVSAQKRAGESLWIADPAPSCPQCHASRWWWTVGSNIVCAQCVPPQPQWSLWQDVHAVLREVPVSDAQHAPLLALAREADVAMERDDWSAFLRIAVRLWRVFRHGSEARPA